MAHSPVRRQPWMVTFLNVCDHAVLPTNSIYSCLRQIFIEHHPDAMSLGSKKHDQDQFQGDPLELMGQWSYNYIVSEKVITEDIEKRPPNCAWGNQGRLLRGDRTWHESWEYKKSFSEWHWEKNKGKKDPTGRCLGELQLIQYSWSAQHL